MYLIGILVSNVESGKANQSLPSESHLAASIVSPDFRKNLVSIISRICLDAERVA